MSSKKYYKLPAELLTSGLTPRAILLYAVIADRAELSKKNELFQDKHGCYIIYRIEDICSVLGIGERTAKYALAELEDFGLIERKKQGRGHPQKIYVHKVQDSVLYYKVQNSAPYTKDKVQDSAPLEVQDSAPPIYLSDNNNTDSSSTASSSTARKLVQLIAMIDQTATELGTTLTDGQIYKLIKRIRKNANKIVSLKSWLKTAVANAAAMPEEEEPLYKATYNIEDYESTSILDELDEDE